VVRRSDDSRHRDQHARRRHVRAYSRDVDPYEWWTTRAAADAYPIEDGVVRFDARTRLPDATADRLPGGHAGEGELHAKLQGRYGGNLDCRELRAARR